MISEEEEHRCCRALSHALAASLMRRMSKTNVNNVVTNDNIDSPCKEFDSETPLERTDAIQRRESDARDYRYLQLSNGMRILLISEPKLKISAIALDVRVGSFCDPQNLQGLAHLCEHVVLAGCQNFPRESFSAFLGRLGGSSNAYTTCAHTNFHFDIPCNFLSEALHRFVSCLECPVFAEQSIRSELELLHCEHEKHVSDDLWRVNQVERATSNPNHVFSRFPSGSKLTLGANLGQLKVELYDFFKSNYSSNAMTMCIMDCKDLDSMEELAQKMLLRVPNRNLPQTIWPKTMFSSKELRQRISIVPLRDTSQLNVTFPVPDMRKFYASSPEALISQLVGHRGPRGLCEFLRQRELVHHIVAGCRRLATNVCFFAVSFHLTDNGERHVDEVARALFRYLHFLREKGVPKYFFEELAVAGGQQLEFEETPSQGLQTASQLAARLHSYPPQEVLVAEHLFKHFRPDLVSKLLDFLVPNNVRLTLLSKSCRFHASRVEPHFGTEYHVEPIAKNLLRSWQNFKEDNDKFKVLLDLPEPNVFIDSSLKLLKVDKNANIPIKPELIWLQSRLNTRVWHASTKGKFAVPKAFVFVRIARQIDENTKTSRFHDKRSVRNCVRAQVAAEMVNVKLQSTCAPSAELAGLFVSVKPTMDDFGLEISVRGLNSKLGLLFAIVIRLVMEDEHLFGDERLFRQVMDRLRRSWKSESSDNLSFLARSALSMALMDGKGCLFSKRERLRESRGLKVNDIADFMDDLRASRDLDIDCLFYGNIERTQVHGMVDELLLSRLAFFEHFVSQQNVELPSPPPHLEQWFTKDPVQRLVTLMRSVHKGSNENCASNEHNGNNEDNEECSEKECKEANEEEENAKDRDELVPSPAELNPNITTVLVLTNEQQSSSCVHYYLPLIQFSCGESVFFRPKSIVLLDLYASLIRTPLLSHLKHSVPLGYAVSCDVRKSKKCLGLRIIVQSQYPLNFVLETIENALAKVPLVISDDDLRSTATMLKTLREPAEMRELAHLAWREISEKSLCFYRAVEEARWLDKIGVEELLKFHQKVQKLLNKNDNYENNCEMNEEEDVCLGKFGRLAVSVGPDPTVNWIEDRDNVKCRLWSEYIEEMRSSLGSYQLRRERRRRDEWLTKVFENKIDAFLSSPFD